MKKKKIFAIVMSVALVASISLTGCGTSTTKKTAGTDSKPDADQHLTLALPVNNVKTMDTSKATDQYSAWVMQEDTESLGRLTVDSKGGDKVEKAGASDWKVSSDGLTWTFTIRDNKWSDGKAVTAGDYAYSILRSLDKATASQYAFLLTGAGIKGATEYNAGKGKATDVGVVAKDDKTLVITLERPCAYFEKLLPNKMFAPQRKDIVEKYGDKYGTTAESMVYNGPFKMTSYKNGDSVELVKNDQYWDKDNVKLSAVTFKFIGDTEALMNALSSGQIASAGVVSKDWTDKLTATKNYDQFKSADPAESYDFFNTKDKLFSNAKVREAFILALDKKDYCKTLWDDMALPAYGWVPFKMMIGDKQYRDLVEEPLKSVKDDPKQTLIAGLKELGMDPDPAKLSVTYLSGGTDQRSKDFADWEINQYKKVLGVTLKASFMEWGQYTKAIDQGNYQMSGMAWSGDYNDPMTQFDMWEKDAGVVVNYWSNDAYDKLVEDAKTTMDNTKRLNDFKQAEQMLLTKEFVINPICYREFNTFTYKYLKNYSRPLFGNGLEIKNAYLSGKTK